MVSQLSTFVRIAVLLGTACATTAYTADAPPPPLAVSLEYRDSGSVVQKVTVRSRIQTTPFAKEPAFSQPSRVYRGWMQLYPDTNSVAFAWERSTGKLHLDLNRNGDLTDDTNGTLTNRGPAQVPGSIRNFPKIHLPMAASPSPGELVFDLEVWDYGARPQLNASVRSMFQGRLTLDGQDWQVGLLLNPFEDAPSQSGAQSRQRLLFRPWESRHREVTSYPDSLDALTFPRKLFVGGHAFDAQRVAVAGDPAGAMKIEFTEQHPALGELRVTGQFVERMILEAAGDGFTLVLDKPGDTVKVPIGKYGTPRFKLGSGGTEAHLETFYGGPTRPDVVVEAGKPAIVVAGGPLTNSVAISRRGYSLSFTHRLIGEGGKTYQLAVVDRSKPPEFAVFQGDKKVASGKFEFG